MTSVALPEPPNFKLGDRIFYFYQAEVTRHYDGDTIWLRTHLGKNTSSEPEPHRLHRIDAPEVRGEEKEEGLIAADWLAQKLPVGNADHD